MNTNLICFILSLVFIGVSYIIIEYPSVWVKFDPNTKCMNGEMWVKDGHGFFEQLDDRHGNKISC